VLTQVVVNDSGSMISANEALVALGLPEIKARLTNDLTASGVNRAALVPPFRYPSLVDGLGICRRDCFLGKCDVSRYFHSFPIAYEARWMFLLMFASVLYVGCRCLFGFAPCPYYCSVWSAEIRTWVIAHNIPCVHMMDDWLTVGDTEQEASDNVDAISSIIAKAGLSMAPEKKEVGSRLVFLGVLIDLSRMTLSFDKTQARGMWVQLEGYLGTLRAGHNMDIGSIRSVAGSLNWYAEVLQSGRMHIRSWWLYHKYHTKFTLTARAGLIKDTLWWMRVLAKWAEDTVANIEYPILTAVELLKTEGNLVVVQSDAAGLDGFGYFYGALESYDPRYYSSRWTEEYQFVHSHNGEMQALLHFVRNTAARGVLVLWVTDCLAAVWSVNKGRCFEGVGMASLTAILVLCDEKRIQLLPLWVPRESNQFADYLSHLAMYRGETEAGGAVRSLSVPRPDGAGPDKEEVHSAEPEHGL